MNINKIILFVLLILFSHMSYSQSTNKIRIDLDKSYGGSFSDYFNNLEFIPLETTKQSLFGLISELTITDSTYIIFDDDTKSVLFFSPSGKFIKRIDKKGNFRAVTFVFDESNKSIIIVFQNTNNSDIEMHKYNLIGDYLEQVHADDINFEELHNKIVFNDKLFWVKNITHKSKTAPNYYYTQYSSSKETISAIPLDTTISYGLFRLTNELGFSRPPKIFDTIFYYSTPLDHKLYKVNAINGETTLLYQFVFPAKFGVNDSLFHITDERTMDNVLKKTWFNDRTVLGLANINADKNKIIFKAKRGVSSSYGSDGSLIARNFMYRYKDNFLVSFEKIIPDDSTYFLPFYNAHTIAREGFYFQNDYIYTSLSSLEVFTAHESNKNRKVAYSSILQEYFTSQNRKSNPVIVRMKLKE